MKYYKLDNERSPLKVIRRTCLACVDGEQVELKNCTGNIPFGALHKPCPIWPFRMGRKPKKWDSQTFGNRYSQRSAIQKYCRICMSNSYKSILDCPEPKCPAYPWRLGKPEKYKREAYGAGAQKHAAKVARLSQKVEVDEGCNRKAPK